MNKLIWSLYNSDLITMEVANLLLDENAKRINKKKYK